jgi:hypothetical protein
MAAVGDLDEVNGRMARAIRAHRQSRRLYKALKRSDVLIIMSYPSAQGVAR